MTAPLVRARVVEYLAVHVKPGVRRWNGQVPVDVNVPAMASALGISVHDAVHTMYDLQKNQIVTFRERKGPGKSGAILSRVRLAQSALNGLAPHDLTTMGEVIDQAIEVLDVAEEMTAQKAKADEAVITYPGITCSHRKVAPQWCVAHDSVWPRGDRVCAAEWERQNPGPEGMDEAGAVAQYDDAQTTPSEAIVDDLPVLLIPPLKGAYPIITALLAERGAQDAAQRAADILTDAGMESLALTVMDAIRSFTPLEEEVFRLAEAVGWTEPDA